MQLCLLSSSQHLPCQVAQVPPHLSFHTLPSSCVFCDLIFPSRLPLAFISAEPECGGENSTPQASLTSCRCPDLFLTHCPWPLLLASPFQAHLRRAPKVQRPERNHGCQRPGTPGGGGRTLHLDHGFIVSFHSSEEQLTPLSPWPYFVSSYPDCSVC